LAWAFEVYCNLCYIQVTKRLGGKKKHKN